MRLLYRLIFITFIICYYPAFAIEALIPGAQINVNDNSVCRNGTAPIITFTGSGGTAPYTFTYKINNGADIVSPQSTGNILTVSQPTNDPGTFTYTIVSVKDATNTTQSINGQSITIIVHALPGVDFTTNANANTCSGSSVQFTSNITNGTPPYTYTWNFGNSETSSAANPVHVFTSLGCGLSPDIPVSLTVTDANGCSNSVTHDIIVKQKPDIEFSDAINPFDPFSNCQNASATNQIYSITVNNISASTCIASYSINWGDNTSETGVSFPISHTYNQLGAYNLTITAMGTNGCSNSKTYVVKNVSNPLGGINSPGSTTNLCAPTPNLQFAISNWATNSPGTTYDVDYGDNTPHLSLTQEQLNSSSYYNAAQPELSANYPIPHIYTTSSCPGTQFTVTLLVTNACGTTPFTTSNISVYTKPIANFTNPASACVNTGVTFINTTSSGFSPNPSCSQNSVYTWNFGDGSPNVSTPPQAPQNITHSYTTPGNYTVTLSSQGFCGISTTSKQICIESPITPLFSISSSNTTGCASTSTPLTVSATNNTVLTNQCNPPGYLWEVSYAPGNCGTGPVVIPNQTTANASFSFSIPGTYTIKLTMSNSCGSFNTSQVIEVKKTPTAMITPIPDICGSGTITPAAVVTACTSLSSGLTYNWSFPGGTPSTSNQLSPPAISYNTTGPHTVSLTVTNECGVSTTANDTFNVNAAPAITNSVLSQTVCSGSNSTAVLLTANDNATTYSWTASATPGITGFLSSGNTGTIPAQTLSTSSGSSGTVTYTITPSLGGCNGTPINYVITVEPAPAIITQPQSSEICQGGIPTTLSVTLSSTSGTPVYQWFSNTVNNNTTGTAISGAQSSSFNPPATVGTIYYYCQIALPASSGCTAITSNTATVTVTPAASITTQPTATQSICVGSAITTPLTVSYSGGTGTASYQWYANTTASNNGGTIISGANQNTYNPGVFSTPGVRYFYVVLSLSGSGCGAIPSNLAAIDVAPDPIITAQPLASQTLCQNSTPTTLSVTASGDVLLGSFTYQWYSNSSNSNSGGNPVSGANAASFIPPTTNVGTTYYYCEVSQPTTSGCSVTSQTAAVILNTAPVFTDQPDSAGSCQGGTVPPLTVSYANGVGTPAFQWYSGPNNAPAGNPIPGATTDTYNPDTNIVGTIYYYCIITFPGTGGCSAITSQLAEIVINAQPAVTVQPTPSQQLCAGGTIPTPLTVGFSGGTGTPVYQWYANNTNSNTGGTAITGAVSNNYTPPAFNTAGNFYYYATITLTGNGCGTLTSDVAAVTVIPDPAVVSQPLALQILCQGAPPNPLIVSATGGVGNFQYQWYANSVNANTGGTAIPTATLGTYTPPTATAGTVYYYCVLTQSGAGCSTVSATAAVTVNPSPAITSQPVSSVICLGATPAVLTVAVVNGVGTPQYQWYSNATNSNTGGIPVVGANTITFTPPANVPGTVFYYCIITLPSGGCSNLTSEAAEVTINPNPEITSTTAAICSGSAFTITPVSGGTEIVPAGTAYTWTVPTINPPGSVSGAAAQSVAQPNISQVLTNTTNAVATVTYNVTPVAGSCSGLDFTVTVTVNPAVNANAVVTQNSCFGVNNASIQTNITGGIPFGGGNPYQLTWTGPNGFTANTTSISGLAPGNYHLSVTDAGGCPLEEDYTITEPDDINITVDTAADISCFAAADGIIAISVTGGTGAPVFAWTKDTLPFAATEDLQGLSPGIYEVTVTDANNCGPKTASFTITQPLVLQLSLIDKTDVICYGALTGAINVNITGGTPIETSPAVFDYAYSWSGPSGFTANTRNLANIGAGNYSLTVTDGNGCTDSLQVVITQPAQIIINAVTTAIECYGDNDASITLTIAGGNPPYQVNWDNLATGTFLDNLAAGTYTVTVTDATNCTAMLPVVIPNAPLFDVSPIVNQISCFGASDGSVSLNFVGGIAPVTLVWSDGSTAGTQRNNLGPGVYTVTITDSKPCVITRTFTIIEPQPLVLTANTINAFDCDDANSGSINLLVSGGTPPFAYNWSNGSNTEDLINIAAGNYLVTVTDAHGCVQTASYSINRQPPLIANVVTDTAFDCATHIVQQSFIADVEGGVPPYTHVWSSGSVSGAQGEIMSTDQNGTVVLDVMDSLGCSTSYSFNVAIPELGYPSFDTSSYAFTTYGAYSIVDPIQFNNTATGDYVSVSWDFGDGSVSTEENPLHAYVREGDYTIVQTVSYPLGCIYTHITSIKITKGYELIMPTAFTPNKDIINDNFAPVYRGLDKVRIDIYNTWGEMVYSEEAATLKGWDGTINGLDSENGNYYFRVSATTFYGSSITADGPFTLIK